MLRSRITPCLLVHKKGLVKTVEFNNPKYVGDPINAVRIFNEKEIDEIMISDIDATVKNLEPNFSLIKNLQNSMLSDGCCPQNPILIPFDLYVLIAILIILR